MTAAEEGARATAAARRTEARVQQSDPIEGIARVATKASDAVSCGRDE